MKAFLYLLYRVMFQASATMADTSNTSRALGGSSQFVAVNAASDNGNFGTFVGSGTTAVGISDYNLATKIAHGNGAGQLRYRLQGSANLGVVGSTASFTTDRNFDNNSGADVDVKEIGLVGEATGTGYYFLLARDVLPSTVTVPNGGVLRVVYTIAVTV